MTGSSYDDLTDVLYLGFGETHEPVAYLETDSGDLLRVERGSGRILGCTIIAFKWRLGRCGKVEVPELASVLPDGLTPYLSRI